MAALESVLVLLLDHLGPEALAVALVGAERAAGTAEAAEDLLSGVLHESTGVLLHEELDLLGDVMVEEGSGVALLELHPGDVSML